MTFWPSSLSFLDYIFYFCDMGFFRLLCVTGGYGVVCIMEKAGSHKLSSSTMILLLDLLISTVASIFAVLYVRWMEHPVAGFSRYLFLWALCACAAALIGFVICGTNKIVIHQASYKSIKNFVGAVVIKETLLLIVLLSGLLKGGYQGSKIMLLLADLAITLIAIIIVRIIIIDLYGFIKSDYEKEVGRLGVLVYGTSPKSVSMLTRLVESANYNVLGFLTRDKEKGGMIRQDCKVYYFNAEEDIENLKINLGVDCILFSSWDDAEKEEAGLARICLRQGIHILASPRIEEVRYDGMSREAVKGFSNNDFIPDGMSSFERNFKRAVDCFLAGVLMVVFSPLFIICTIALKIGGGPGPVIYKQERIGRFGRPFNILKFRSMRVDAEADGPQLLAGEDDPRLTKVGRFLRQHHLDELPQLWNVFTGDMAFIGWRPERKYYIDQIMEVDPRYYYLYQIRPGVTSYATLKNGYTDSMDKMIRRLEFDLYYLRHRSIWFDIRILWQTFVNIAFGKKF